MVKTLSDFIEVVEKDHPIVTEIVKSGEINSLLEGQLDICAYTNYMYESKHYYSKDGWFLIGDAAFLFDPINSLGISYVSHMICQVAAMITKDKKIIFIIVILIVMKNIFNPFYLCKILGVNGTK